MVKGYHVTAGYENLILGSAIPGQGSDGIIPGDSRMTAKIEVKIQQVVETKPKDEVEGEIGKDDT